MSAFRAILAAVLFAAGPAAAVTINGEAGDPQAISLGVPFDGVAQIEFIGGRLCSGSLVAPTVVLTARHCTNGSSASGITARFEDKSDGVTFSRGVTAIAEMAAGSAEFYDGTDIALLTLANAVTELTPYRLWAEFGLGDIFRMVGYGHHADPAIPSSGEYDGVRRAADNTVDAIGESSVIPAFGPMVGAMVDADHDDPSGTSNTLASVGSSPTMLLYEGGPAIGDSGGPIMFDRAGEWVIGGVLTGGTTTYGTYGDISQWTSVAAPAARDFIGTAAPDVSYAAPIPLPASVAMLALALAGLVGLRRRTIS